MGAKDVLPNEVLACYQDIACEFYRNRRSGRPVLGIEFHLAAAKDEDLTGRCRNTSDRRRAHKAHTDRI